jgi:flagellar protein FlgJ
VPHHLILAQAALESGWGQRQIRKENGEPSFNIFGVKATSSWKGQQRRSPPPNTRTVRR